MRNYPGYHGLRLGFFLLAASCTGQIGEQAAGSPSSDEPGAGGGDPGVSDPGSVNPDNPDNPAPLADVPFQPSPAGLRRLTSLHYRNSVRDLLGSNVNVMGELDPDDKSDTFASVGGYRVFTSPHGVDRYSAMAYAASAEIFATAAKRGALVGCTPSTSTDSCGRGFVQTFGRRVFRRPLTTAENDRYLQIVSTVGTSYGDPWKGLEFAVAAFLQSPNFLYVTEFGDAAAAGQPIAPLDPYEIATRLSYFLWDTTPDNELLDAAESRSLMTLDGLGAQVDRLLASARAAETVKAFFNEHLGTDQLSAVTKDTTLYPKFTPTLLAAMGEELDRRIADLAFGARGDFLDLFDGRSTFVNAELARHYGVTVPAGATWSPVTLPDSGQRAGLLTMAGVLSRYATSTRSSPTRRGVFIRQRLLCETVPPPPANVDTKLPTTTGAAAGTLRQRLDQHRSNPACSGCHAFFDPMGYSLENFDGIGAYRTSDNGLPVDASGEIDGTAYRGATELAGLLRADARTSDCLARQVFTFATGHRVTAGEEGVLGKTVGEFGAASNGFSSLIKSIATNDGFRFIATAQ